MNNTVKILDWDSSFFNIRVARIEGTVSGEAELTRICDELEKQEIDLGYYSSSSQLAGLEQFQGQYDFGLVDRKTTYFKTINRSALSHPAVSEYKKDFSDDKLFELAIQSGMYSRFNVDRKIGRNNYEAL